MFQHEEELSDINIALSRAMIALGDAERALRDLSDALVKLMSKLREGGI